jgi:hypothetical protein
VSTKTAVSLPLAAVSVAAALDRPGTWAWAVAISDGRSARGTVPASTLGEADALIAEHLRRELPGMATAVSLGGYGEGPAGRHFPGAVESLLHLPCCEAVRNERSASPAPPARPGPAPAAIALRKQAEALLPVIPVHPAWRPVQVPEGEPFSPWTVACDGSATVHHRNNKIGWAFVTGAGWAGCDQIPVGANAQTAEFTACCRALGFYPDGSEVTLITDSIGSAEILVQISQGRVRRRWAVPDPIVGEAMYHAERLRLNVEWAARNTHPLQEAAHRLAGATTGTYRGPTSFGLLGFSPLDDLTSDEAETIKRLLAERTQARAEKNWARADEIRATLSELGLQVSDTSAGTGWRLR